MTICVGVFFLILLLLLLLLLLSQNRCVILDSRLVCVDLFLFAGAEEVCDGVSCLTFLHALRE